MPDAGDAGDLYALPPEEFTAARDALVRTLREAKERDKADAVKKLRRPSATAWALNQVARAEPASIHAVLDLGSALKDAQGRGDGAVMRQTERSLRQASDAVVDAAGEALVKAGHAPNDDVRSRMAATLRAAVIDAEVAERLRGARLEREVELAGFGLDDIVAAPSSRQPDQRPKARTSPDEKARKNDELEERRRRNEAVRAERARVAGLEKNAERLTGRAERLADQATAGEQAAREARAEAEDARRRAAAATEEASAARQKLESMA